MIDIRVLYTFLSSKAFVLFDISVWKTQTLFFLQREIPNNTTTIKKHFRNEISLTYNMLIVDINRLLTIIEWHCIKHVNLCWFFNCIIVIVTREAEIVKIKKDHKCDKKSWKNHKIVFFHLFSDHKTFSSYCLYLQSNEIFDTYKIFSYIFHFFLFFLSIIFKGFSHGEMCCNQHECSV